MTTQDRNLTSPAYRALARTVMDRDLGLCQIRGPRCTTYATEVDHIVARADGGAVFDPHNMRASCRQCNGWRAAQRTNAMRYAKGVAVYETRM